MSLNEYREWSDPFYKSKEWKKCRKGFMASKNYQCERCGNPGEIAHHKTYITIENITDPTITLNWDNLECLCLACHNAEHGEKTTKQGYLFDENGYLIPDPQLNNKK